VVAIALAVERGRIVRDVDVVPVGGVPLLAANLIRPACDLGVGDVSAVEQLGDRGLGLRREMGLGDQGDDLVTLAAPGEAKRRFECNNCQQ
jgi:hypothetical protein